MIFRLLLKLILLVMLVFTVGCSEDKETKTNSTLQLFDGKTFNGWEGDLNWFRIEEGAPAEAWYRNIVLTEL